MRMLNAINEDHVGFRVVGPQRQYRLIGGRGVPSAHVLPVGKFDDDQVALPIVFDDLDVAAMMPTDVQSNQLRTGDPVSACLIVAT